MPKVLRDEINEAVTRYLEHKLQTNSADDVAAMAREMAQRCATRARPSSIRAGAALISASCRFPPA
jgi:hypothetical protein